MAPLPALPASVAELIVNPSLHCHCFAIRTICLDAFVARTHDLLHGHTSKAPYVAVHTINEDPIFHPGSSPFLARCASQSFDILRLHALRLEAFFYKQFHKT